MIAMMTITMMMVAADPEAKPWSLGGYVEANYQWNLQQPHNGVTHARGFDNRHNSFTLPNVALDAQWDDGHVVGRITAQVGHTPATYYLAEPSFKATSLTGGSDASLWQFVQQAYVGYRFDVGGGLLVSAGLFLSPIGPEGMAVRDNWQWSRSNLFFGLPFYHSGAKMTYSFDDHWSITGFVLNGWNNVLDNNDEKSLALQLNGTRSNLALSLLLFTGVERAKDAAEGRAWRTQMDAHVTWQIVEWLSVLVHANGGIEPNTFGNSGWVAAAAYARLQLSPMWRIAGRADAFREHVATGASSIFWPVPWVASGTATLEFMPHERVSVRLEGRHDQAADALYFDRNVVLDDNGNAAPTSAWQDTLTLGATTWF